MTTYVVPPDTRSAGSGNPAQDVDELADMDGLLASVLAQFLGAGTNLDPGGNAANVSAILAARTGATLAPAAAGTVLTSNGTNVAPTFQTSSTLASLFVPTPVKTGAYAAAAGDFVPCDTTAGGFTVTLPTAPADRTVIGVKMVKQAAANTVTLATGGSDVFNVAAGAATGTLTLLNQGALLQYKASNAVWYVFADDLPLSGLDARYALLDTSAGDLQASPGTAAAGAVGKASDAGHVHPQPPVLAPTGLTGATAASRYCGATISGAPVGGTFAVGDFVIDQTGQVWVCTVAGTPGTWTSIGGGGVTLNSTNSNLKPDGTAAAGALTTAARADHVHPENAWQSGLMLPTGGLAESYSRMFAIGFATPTSGVAEMQLIPLQKGMVVSNIHLVVINGAGGTTHGWVGLCDTSFNVLAVSADLTTAAFTGSPGDFPVALTSSYTVPATGAYYAAFSVTGSIQPQFATPPTPTILGNVPLTLSPQIAPNRGTQQAPPTVSTVVGSVTFASASLPWYVYVS